MNSQLSATSEGQIRNRSGKLAGANIRNYPQPTGSESANAGGYPLALKRPGDQFLESSDNDPINSGNLPTGPKNPTTIHRRFGLIHRSGSRSGSPNRKVIVNRVPVIVNFAAWNLSPIHHPNAEIYHLARRQPTVQLLESSDNHPTKRKNHPNDSSNRAIIDRRKHRMTDPPPSTERLTDHDTELSEASHRS